MRQIDIDEVQRLQMEENAHLVEVLSRESFGALHIPEAISLPLAEIDRTGATRLEASLPIVVYCYDHQ